MSNFTSISSLKEAVSTSYQYIKDHIPEFSSLFTRANLDKTLKFLEKNWHFLAPMSLATLTILNRSKAKDAAPLLKGIIAGILIGTHDKLNNKLEEIAKKHHANHKVVKMASLLSALIYCGGMIHRKNSTALGALAAYAFCRLDKSKE